MPFPGLFEFVQRPGQVDVFGDVAVILLTAAQIRPAKTGRHLQQVARTQFRQFAVIIVEHEIQLWCFRALNQQPRIAFIGLRRLQKAYGHARLSVIPLCGAADGRIPVQGIGCEAECSTRQNEKKHTETAVCPVAFPQKQAPRQYTDTCERQDEALRQEIKGEEDGSRC